MRLSMITVCFNAENSIEKTMTSVLLQTKPVYEYILIDGKSNDATNEKIERNRCKFENAGIRFIHISEKDKGISDAFNKGIKLATGDLIGLINADDELEQNANEILNEKYDDNNDIYYGNCTWMDEQNGIYYERKANPAKLSEIRYEMVLIHPSTFIKRISYEKYGLYDISYKYCMDEELLTRFYEAGARFTYIDEILSVFRAGGVSDLGIKKTLDEGLKLALNNDYPNYIKAYFSYYLKLGRYKLSAFLKKNGYYEFLKKDLKKLK